MRKLLRGMLCLLACLMMLCWLPLGAYADEIIAPVLENEVNEDFLDDDEPIIIEPMLMAAPVLRSGSGGSSGYSIYYGLKRGNVFLSGATVELYDADDNVIDAKTTVPDGYTEFSGLENGVYTLKVSRMPDGFLTPEDKVALINNANETINVNVAGGVELPSTGSAWLPVMYAAGAMIILFSVAGRRRLRSR